jgi:hypothetical protein
MSHVAPVAGARGAAGQAVSVPSSEAKKGFANLIERVVRTNKPVVVMLSVGAYERLVAAAPDPLAGLRREFDQLLATMQTPKAKAGAEALFAATPAQLGAAAVKAARKGGH